MQIASTTRDGVVVVAPAGVIDTRTAQAFEATMVKAFGEGERAFAVDFSRVDLITSAGIRVLVMMAHRLQRGVGGLVLFALGDRVRTVLEIGGLLQQFRIVATESQAFELLAAPAAPKAPASPVKSRLSGLVLDVVGGPSARPGQATAPAGGAKSVLASTVLGLVSPSS